MQEADNELRLVPGDELRLRYLGDATHAAVSRTCASAAKNKGMDNYKQGKYADAIKWLSWADQINLADVKYPLEHFKLEDPTENRRGENQQNRRVPESATNANADGHANTKTNMMDLNMQPHQIHEQASNNQ
ncbi:unnamed protein product [Camellia sinensis]